MRKPRRLSPEELAPFVYDPPPYLIGEPPPVIDWPTLFGDDKPVEVEVGFGKGAFLVREASRRADVNFLGIEIERKYAFYTANRVARRGLRHVRVCAADAKPFVRDRVAAASVDVIHVYFPDPWWKRRHWKRRLFTPDFAASCAAAIRPGGRLSIATDVAEYFDVMTAVVDAMPEFARTAEPSPALVEDSPEGFTNFERKAVREGRTVQGAVYERPGTSTNTSPPISSTG